MGWRLEMGRQPFFVLDSYPGRPLGPSDFFLSGYYQDMTLEDNIEPELPKEPVWVLLPRGLFNLGVGTALAFGWAIICLAAMWFLWAKAMVAMVVLVVTWPFRLFRDAWDLLRYLWDERHRSRRMKRRPPQ